MLNSYPLNSLPLNSLPPSGDEEPDIDTVVISPGASFAWTLQVLLGGVDVTDQLTGTVRIECAEDGDSVATFALWLGDRKSTRLNSSHVRISYAVFCLKKKKKKKDCSSTDKTYNAR